VYTSWIETLDNLNKKWLNVFGDSTTKSMTKSVKSIKSDSERYYFLRPGEIGKWSKENRKIIDWFNVNIRNISGNLDFFW